MPIYWLHVMLDIVHITCESKGDKKTKICLLFRLGLGFGTMLNPSRRNINSSSLYLPCLALCMGEGLGNQAHHCVLSMIFQSSICSCVSAGRSVCMCVGVSVSACMCLCVGLCSYCKLYHNVLLSCSQLLDSYGHSFRWSTVQYSRCRYVISRFFQPSISKKLW